MRKATRTFIAMICVLGLAVTTCFPGVESWAADSGSAPGAPPDKPGGGDSSVTYTAVREITADTAISQETISSTGTDENAILVSGGTLTMDNSTVSRTSDSSTGGDNASFYGVGAGILTKGGTAVISNSTISSNAKGGAGVFSYDSGVSYVKDTSITTQKSTSGGIHAAGGGSLYAYDCDVTTSGESSAAIRSDRGGGTMVVDGGTYTSNGSGSPAVYCTADISVNNSALTANASEGVCIEGLNTLRLYGSSLTCNMPDDSQNDSSWSVILYQSNSGDSKVGCATFTMDGGSLTSKNGGLFCTTNTESEFVLKNVDISSTDDDYFLMCTGNSNSRGWGSTGSNGADCEFTAIQQDMQGNILWDSISNLDLYLTSASSLTGAILDDESYTGGSTGSGYANVYISSDSTWTLTGNSTLTNLYNAGSILDSSGNTVTIRNSAGTALVQGSSSCSITVTGTYSTEADLSGAGSIDSYSNHKVAFPGEEEETKYVEFGSYPQREVVSQASDSGVYEKAWATENDYIIDPDLYSSLSSLAEDKWDAKGDTTYDGSKYRRIKAGSATYNAATDTKNTPDLTLYYNWSSTDVYHYFKYEPIKWRVLKEEGDDLFLLSEIILDDQKTNAKIIAEDTWETCTVRSWLNGYDNTANTYGTDYTDNNFLDTAFTDAEQARIKSSNLENKDNIKNGTEGGNDTVDKLFLLSEEEVYGETADQYGFAVAYNTEDSARQAGTSTYAKAMGSYADTDTSCLGSCDWWLRSPGSQKGLTATVKSSGRVNRGGEHADSKTRGIRPAMHISTDTEGGTEEQEHHYTATEAKAASSEADGNTAYWYCSDCDKYYADAEGNTEITKDSWVIRKIGSIELSAGEATYNGAVQKPTVSVKDSEGAVIDSGNYDISYDEGFKNAGKYNVVVTFKNLYSGKKTLEFTISKATPVYIEPVGLTAHCGQALKDLTLPKGFTWEATDDTSVGPARSNSFKVTYTPDDTANYESVTGIDVTVAVSHSYGETWFNDDTSHWHQCVCGAKADEECHSFGDWITTKEPTCTEKGSRHRLCSDCGYEETEEIQVLGHAYVHKTVAAKIGVAGSSYDQCSRCGEIINRETLKALKPSGTAIRKLTAASKAFTVKWAKKSYTGYEIRYSLKSSMASAKIIRITKAATTSKKISKLKSKKKYYVQIRTYKTVSGKRCYSSWSKIKTVKTK